MRAAPYGPHSGRLRGARSWLVAAAGGTIWALAFGAQPRHVLPWVALVPLLLVVQDPRIAASGAFLRGLLHGVLYWLVAVPWIAPTVATFGGMPVPVSVLALLATTLILGFWHGVFALLVHRLSRPASLVPWLSVPAAWVVAEWARGHVPAFAFPWNLAGYAWVAMPGALELTPFVGTYGLSFLLLFANVGIALGMRRRRPSIAVIAILVPLGLLALGARFGDQKRWAPEPGNAEAVEVVLVQPGGRLLGNETDAATAFQRLLSESRAACRPGGASPARDARGADRGGRPRLLVWPESAAYPHGWETSPMLRREVQALADEGCYVLLNAPLESGGGYENAALLIGPVGVVNTYAKRRLVPFGEYVPLARLLPMIGPLARINESFQPGRRGPVLRWDGPDLGMAICYEVTFPELVAAGVRSGAGILVTITNDAWYGDSSAPHQHLRAARFRAAETRRPLVRAALTGISAVIDPRGQVRERLDVGEAGRIEASILPRRGRTFYAQAPWLVPLVCLLLVTAFGIIPSRADRKSHTQAEPARRQEID